MLRTLHLCLLLQDYGFWGTAMSFPQHDSVARRVRDMVDDEGKPLETNEYQAGAKSKSFIQPLLEVPSDYGKLDYDDGKEVNAESLTHTL